MTHTLLLFLFSDEIKRPGERCSYSLGTGDSKINFGLIASLFFASYQEGSKGHAIFQFLTDVSVSGNTGCPGDSAVKNLPVSAGDARDASSNPGLGRSPGEGNGNPDHMDRGVWWATVHGAAESDMTEQLSTHAPTQGNSVCATDNISSDSRNFHLSNPTKDQLIQRGSVEGQCWSLSD